jgi:hypothetical protein
MLFKIISYIGIASVYSRTVLDSDPNSNLLARLLPLFEAEESNYVSKGAKPLLGGETEYSLGEATARIQSLVDSGILEKDKAERLVQSLHYAERVRHIASLMDGGKMVN